MTREEAIKIMSQMIKDEEGFLSDGTIEAHKMAIKALEHPEQNVIAVVPCGDAISRQAAENLFRNARAKLNASKYKTMAEFNLRDSMLLNAEQLIHLLPSVHAEPRTGHWINEGQYAEGHSERWYRCSECGGHIIEMIPDDYCKFCGAKMESEEQI